MDISSVDPREVDYYTEMADTWWDREGPFWPLHLLNELRVDWIRDQACAHFNRDPRDEAPLSGLTALDVGCGGGLLSESLARLGASVRGIDVVDRNIGVARLHARNAGLNIEYEKTSAETRAEQGAHYDIVLNMEVVEHVADLDGFVKACCDLVAPAGMMFVSTINRTPLSWLLAIVGAEYILRLLPRGTHRWSMFRKPAEIEALIAANGLRQREITGVRVNPFTRNFTLQSSTAVNYMLSATRGE